MYTHLCADLPPHARLIDSWSLRLTLAGYIFEKVWQRQRGREVGRGGHFERVYKRHWHRCRREWESRVEKASYVLHEGKVWDRAADTTREKQNKRRWKNTGRDKKARQRGLSVHCKDCIGWWVCGEFQVAHSIGRCGRGKGGVCVFAAAAAGSPWRREEDGLSAVTARVEPVRSCRHAKSLNPTKPLNQSVSPGDKICNFKRSDTNTGTHKRACVHLSTGWEAHFQSESREKLNQGESWESRVGKDEAFCPLVQGCGARWLTFTLRFHLNELLRVFERNMVSSFITWGIWTHQYCCTWCSGYCEMIWEVISTLFF